jgi:CxxC motif-containing protein
MPKEETAVITCVACPLGCQVRLTLDDRGEVVKVEDNECKEGEKYAVEEYKNPVRVLTATVLTTDSRHALLPVRTNKPILRDLMIQGMNEIAKVNVKPPVREKQVIITNLLNTGADVIASGELVD